MKFFLITLVLITYLMLSKHGRVPLLTAEPHLKFGQLSSCVEAIALLPACFYPSLLYDGKKWRCVYILSFPPLCHNFSQSAAAVQANEGPQRPL